MTDTIKRIEKLTKENGITGIELGKILGLKKSPLTDWKNGKSKPTLEQTKKICEIFGISADFLLNTGKELTEEEEELLEYFRKCNNGNKQVILNAAKSLQQIEPEPEQEELKSFDSKIG